MFSVPNRRIVSPFSFLSVSTASRLMVQVIPSFSFSSSRRVLTTATTRTTDSTSVAVTQVAVKSFLTSRRTLCSTSYNNYSSSWLQHGSFHHFNEFYVINDNKSESSIQLIMKGIDYRTRSCRSFTTVTKLTTNTLTFMTGILPYDRRLFSSSSSSSSSSSTSIPQGYTKPTLDVAKAMKLSLCELDNTSLTTLGSLGHHGAQEEILKRHIMAVDNIEYDDATAVFLKIREKNDESAWFLSLPFKIGIITAVTSGIVSVPLVFHQHTAEWFNETFVTSDVPEPKDMETFFEVGSWTWNWCEPPLGTISFVLLCMQFARSQMDNLGFKPYTQRVKQWRAANLAAAFPKYDSDIIMDYSRGADFFRFTKAK